MADEQTGRKVVHHYGKYGIRVRQRKHTSSRRKQYEQAVKEANFGRKHIRVDEDGNALNHILCIETGKKFTSIRDAAKEYNIRPDTLSRVMNTVLDRGTTTSRDYTRNDGTKVTYQRTGQCGWNPANGQDLHWKWVI